MISNATLRSNLAWALRWMEIIPVLVLVVSLTRSSGLTSHRRLTFGDATSDAARAEVTAVGQVLETHLGLLWVVAIAGSIAAPYVKS